MKKYLFVFVLAFTFIVLLSCSKDDGEESLRVTSSPTLSLSRDQTSQVTCNKTDVKYSSEDEFVAVVSESGLITANHIGETYISINGQKLVKVTVNAVYTDFQEPVKEFNVSASVIKSKEVGTPKSETSTTLIYNPVKKEYARAYVIKNGLVSSSMMVVNSMYSTILSKFILERYSTIDINKTSYKEDGYLTLHGNGITAATITMLVAVNLENINYFSLLYLPVDPSSVSTYSKLNELSPFIENTIKEIEKPNYLEVVK